MLGGGTAIEDHYIYISRFDRSENFCHWFLYSHMDDILDNWKWCTRCINDVILGHPTHVYETLGFATLQEHPRETSKIGLLGQGVRFALMKDWYSGGFNQKSISE